MILSSILLAGVLAAQTGLSYSGEVSWDADSGTVTFRTSGSMPLGKEAFFWRVPAEVNRIVLAKDVTVTGAFRVPFRPASKPLRIEGAGRKASVLHGTDEEAWTARNKIPENDKWTYSAISVLADAVVHVSNLTVKNPRGYLVSGYANKSVIHVRGCDLLDTRPGDNNNSDGFIGSAGSSIRDSRISTADDGIKIYHDITIENVVIEQHPN